MSDKFNQCDINDEFNSFRIYQSAPIPGTEGTEEHTVPVVQRILNDLAANFHGIEVCLRSTLELDASAYSYNITGTPVRIARMGGDALGYSIHVSVYPALEPRKPKDVRRVAKLPRAKH
jgi:hypothetical protein